MNIQRANRKCKTRFGLLEIGLVFLLTIFLLALNLTFYSWKTIKLDESLNESNLIKSHGLLAAAESSSPIPVDEQPTFVNGNNTKNEIGQEISSGPVFVSVSLVDWKKTDVRALSYQQIHDYLFWTNQSACQISQDFGGFLVSSAKGVVSFDGQKPVCLDSPVAPSPKKCLVYSFGINNDWSFDEAMELYGCEVFAFDPSMNVTNYNRTNNIHFYEMALEDKDKDEWNNKSIPSRTLSSIYNMLKSLHGGDSSIIDYLKIDIETTEWRVLPEIIQSGMMDKVMQLAVEIHLDCDESIVNCRHQAGILQNLEHYGMVRFDSKPNMYSMSMNDSVFNSYEIAWYNNRLVRL